MKRLAICFAVFCLAAGCVVTDPERQSNRERSQELLEDADWQETRRLFEKLALCAVTLRPAGSGSFLPTPSGTGVLISKDGHILTCAHVVELMCDLPAPGEDPGLSRPVRELLVGFSSGHTLSASLVAFNRKFDLALLQTRDSGFPICVEPEAGPRTMPGDVLVALVQEGENEPIDRLITAGKVIVPHSALPIPDSKSRFSSGLLFRAFGYAGMSGAPLFNRDGRFVGIIKKGILGAYGDGTSFLLATPADDIVRLLPELKRGVSDGAYFTPREFLAERERQSQLQWRLAKETNPGFEEDERYVAAVGVLVEQFRAAIDAVRGARNLDKFAETIAPVCVLDIYTAGTMYPPDVCGEIEAFFEREEMPLLR